MSRLGRAVGLWAALLLCMGTGCTKLHGNFPVLSNRQIDTTNLQLSTAQRRSGVVGQDVLHLFFIIPSKGQVTLGAAIDDALDKGNGDLMLNAAVRFWSWSVILYGQEGWSVKGDVVNTRVKRGPASVPAPAPASPVAPTLTPAPKPASPPEPPPDTVVSPEPSPTSLSEPAPAVETEPAPEAAPVAPAPAP